MILRAEPLAAAEIGAALARTILLEQAIDPEAHQLAEQAVGRAVRVAEQNVTRLEVAE